VAVMRMLTLIRVSLAAAMVAASATAVTAQSLAFEYYHLDALGSVRVVTDQDRNIVRRHDYFPFGEEVPPQPLDGDGHRFTGKPRVAETVLDYLGARDYSAAIGRFQSIDPGSDVADSTIRPQRWNRYSYAFNSPLRFVDPDGRWGWLVARVLSGAAGAGLVSPQTAARLSSLAAGAHRAVETVVFRVSATLGQPVPRATGTVWDSVKATAAAPSASGVPRSFELIAGRGGVWVNPHVAKHFEEFAGHLAKRGLSPEGVALGMQVHLASLQGAVQEALRVGVRFGEVMKVGGWELMFALPSKSGGLPVLYHALPIK
jgi:RHS repeat-associated protein